MTKQEFKRVYAVAQEPQTMTEDESYQAYVALGVIGIPSDKSRRLATVKMCAVFLRYHALQFNNVWDMQELENFQIWYRKVDLLD
jgi:hypothetical protein